MAATRRPGRRTSSGFSMVEVLVGMALVSFIALSTAPLVVLGARVGTISREVGLQLTSGEAQMETLRTLAFSDPGLIAGGSITTSVAGYSIDDIDGDGKRFMRWKIEDISAHMKRIQVLSAAHASEYGPPREVFLEAYRTDLR